jgi:N-acetylneuraminic acid mutarotase
VLCNGQCINIDADARHCGGCNNACAMGRTCQAKVCGPKWLPTPAPPAGFAARSRAAYAWTGSAVFIWGGATSSGVELNTGAFYDPAQTGAAAWTLLPVTTNTPSARVLATAVWTGSSIVVWGGGDRESTQDYNSGSVYDPVTRIWTKMKQAGAPSARRAALGIWTGTRVLIWGGYDRAGNPEDHAYLYDPAADAWTPVPPGNEPDPTLYPASAWSGTQLYVFGGIEGGFASNDFRVYSAATNTWSAPATATLSRRDSAFGGFDGSYFVVWGGRPQSSSPTSGFRYDPLGVPAPTWTSVATTGTPTPRYVVPREHGWVARVAAGKLLMLGGFDPMFVRSDASTRRDGAVYNSTTNTWTSLPAWPSGHARRFPVAVWMGSEFLLWGGESAGVASNTGERLLP